MTKIVSSLLLFQFLLASPRIVLAQSQPQASKDPTAMLILAGVSAACGWTAQAGPTDAVATGSVTGQKPSGATTQKIVLKARPGHQVRIELAGSGIVSVVNGEQGKLDRGSSPAPMQPQQVYSLFPSAFPFFTEVVQYQDPSLSVSYLGTQTVQGTLANLVEIKRSFAAGDGLDQERTQTSDVTVSISITTNLPLAIDHFVLADADPSSALRLTSYLSDYRQVGSLLIPFHIEEYTGDRLIYTMQFDTIQINVGLPDSDFSVQ